MSARNFRAALEEPDNNASHQRLHELTTGDLTVDAALPSIAAAYLLAFCDNNFSVARRRWVGIALSRMIKSAPSVAQHLTQHSQELRRVGGVILTETASEDTKIVTGLIIREGLARQMQYRDLWPDEKVPNSMPAFPDGVGSDWMRDFQDFMDDLEKLKLTQTTKEVGLIWAIALVTSDGYKWTGSTQERPLMVVQGDLLSIITFDPELCDIGFLDIPLQHIQTIRCERYLLHDSQGREHKQEPWSIVLQLLSNPWSYRINAAERDSRKITIVMEHQRDAEECKKCVDESLSRISRRKIASSGKIDFSQPSPGQADKNTSTRPLEHAPRASCDDGDAMPGHDDAPTAPQTVQLYVDVTRSSKVSASSKNIGSSLETVESESPSTSLSLGAGAINPRPVGPESRSNGPDAFVTQSQANERKPGTLPIVKNSSQRGEGPHSLPVTSKENEVFDFPVASPRMKRPVRTARKSFVKVNGATSAGPGPSKADRSNGRRREVHRDKDDDSSASQRLPRHSTQAKFSDMKSKPGDEDRVIGKPEVRPERSPGSSSLPKISESWKGRAATSIPAEDDVYAIPKDQNTRSRPKRKSTRSVAYVPGETSCEESSGSEYVEVGKRRTSSPNKQLRATNDSQSRVSKAKSTRGAKKTKSSTTKADIKRSQEVHLPPQLPPKSRNPPDMENTKIVESKAWRGRINSRASKEQRDEKAHRSGQAPVNTNIGIINKLNTIVSRDEDGLMVDESSRPRTEPQARKRSREQSPPSTPPPKRARRDEAIATLAATNFSAKGTLTIAPVRILEDPSSPCSRQKQLPSNKIPPTLAKCMQPPGKPNDASIVQRSVFEREHNSGGRHTPLTRRIKRNHSDGSASQELLSSNSKPTPASPHAESTAISGHADRQRVTIEQEIGEYEIEKSDPFNRRCTHQRDTTFTRRLTGTYCSTIKASVVTQECPIVGEDGGSSDSETELVVELPVERSKLERTIEVESKSQVQNPGKQWAEQPRVEHKTKNKTELAKSRKLSPTKQVDYHYTVVHDTPLQTVEDTQLPAHDLLAETPTMEGDTLVEPEEAPLPNDEQSQTPCKSSPPVLSHPSSSHSSTSAELEPRSDSISASQADEMEWEESLQPHQRNLQEQLLRVSRRVIRHIVDSETAIEDIAKDYSVDGQLHLQMVANRHSGKLARMFDGLERRKGTMKNAAEQMLEKLAKHRQDIMDDATSME